MSEQWGDILGVSHFSIEAWILFALIVLFAHMTEMIVGFGCTLISLTIGAHLFDMNRLVPILVPLNLILSAYVVVFHHKKIAGEVLCKKILPLTSLGLIVGITVFHEIHSPALQMAFGLFVTVFALKELVWRGKRAAVSILEKSFAAQVISVFCLIGGGIMQGMFGAGGPLIVYDASRRFTDRGAFRSTLATLWLILNLILFSSHLSLGYTTFHTLTLSATLLPCLGAGIILGEWLHLRMPERMYRLSVFYLLIIAGVLLVVKGRAIAQS